MALPTPRQFQNDVFVGAFLQSLQRDCERYGLEVHYMKGQYVFHQGQKIIERTSDDKTARMITKIWRMAKGGNEYDTGAPSIRYD